MEEPGLFSFEGPGCLVARRDYGFPPVKLPGWREADLGTSNLLQVLTVAGKGGLILRRAEFLEGWSRTRSGPALWKSLTAMAATGGLILECRLPKHARSLLGKLRSEGERPLFWETPSSGQIPPLYTELASQPRLLRLHLEHEWWTAMGAARGDVALLRIAVALAVCGTASAPELAGRLGITSGAVRSYLSWMEEAALIRRDGRRVELRHPLLGTLFKPPVPWLESVPMETNVPMETTPRGKTWDPIELD